MHSLNLSGVPRCPILVTRSSTKMPKTHVQFVVMLIRILLLRFKAIVDAGYMELCRGSLHVLRVRPEGEL